MEKMKIVVSVVASLVIFACKGNDGGGGSAAATGTPGTPSAHVAVGATSAAAPIASVASASGTTIAVRVDGDGFTPSSASFKKGEHAQLVFTRTTDKTCAKDVVFPELNLKKPLPLNEAVAVDVPTADARSLTFQCGMGMYKSSVTIR